MDSVDLALAGVAVGSIAALSGIGLLVTYRTNGVLNLAHGGIATLAAYLLRQLVVVWHWPLAVAAPLVLAVVAPGFGLLLERFVFRPLARRRASAAESLVASLGLLVLCLGLAFAIWGGGARQDAPNLFPTDRIHLWGSATIGADALGDLGLVLLIAAVLGVVAARTRFGRQVRAVVDDRALAELSGIPADRVAAVGWATGSTLAALTGILLAPRLSLDPYALTLLVLETFAVVVAARLASFTVAIVTALAIGIGQSEMDQITAAGTAGELVRSLAANLFVAVLLVLLLAIPKLRELGDAGAAGSFSSRGAPHGDRGRGYGRLLGVFLLLVPLTFDAVNLRAAFQVPALALIFLSLVVVTGYAGQVSLGVAGFAGLGALFAADLAQGDFPGLPAFPGIAAIVVGALFVAPVGWLFGYPTIRRRGLTLALTTFAVGAVVSRFVFQQASVVSGLEIVRPTVFGSQLSDRGFYVLELICLGVGLWFVRNLHLGRLGRALLAIRDNRAGAAGVGVDVREVALLSFTASSVLAGLGGALLVQTAGSFDANAFDPLQSLLWFTAVIVFGADSAAGAVAAAGLIVTLDTIFGAGSSTLAIGLLALALGVMPGGAAEATRRLLVLGRDQLLAGAVPAGRTGVAPVAVPFGAGPVDLVVRTADGRLLRPTPFGAALIGRVRTSPANGRTTAGTGS